MRRGWSRTHKEQVLAKGEVLAQIDPESRDDPEPDYNINIPSRQE
jgi:hypothetical protein